MAQAAVILFGFHLTGGCANPARWFGTAVWRATVPPEGTRIWADHPVYWAGPILGALVAGLVYRSLLTPTGHAPPPTKK